MMATDKVGSNWGTARPEVVAIIKALFTALDPSNITEATIMYEIEKADRICRVQDRAANRMMEYENDAHRDTPWPSRPVS